MAEKITPSKTYKIDFTNKRIIGTVDGHQAIIQFCRKVLNTDKYAYAIYDWYYGNQLYTLQGKSVDYAIMEIPRIIIDALMQDSRITNIYDWYFEKTNVDSLYCRFTVESIFTTPVVVDTEVKL